MINATKKGVKGAVLFVLTFLFSYGAVHAQSNLFFSEFIEGSGNNKAFEIYNPSDEEVDLGDYIVLGNYNGNPYNDTLRFPAGTMLAAGDVFVVAHADADAAITAEADSLVQNPFEGGSSFIAVFNGDDARGLFHVSGTDTTLLDVFGTTEEDPGSGWDVSGVSAGTKDHTLVRKAAFESGNTMPLGSFGLGSFSSEWIVSDQDDFSNIGSHEVGVPFTIREFNRYRNMTEFSESAIESHPLADSTRTFTAVVTSYPKSSGLANPGDSDNDGTIDEIGRIHIFVTDTHAVSMGREGMSIQIVESFEFGDNIVTAVEDFTRGDVVEFEATLGYFGGTAQVDVESVNLLGNVNEDYTEYASLLDPWEVDLTEINSFEGGQLAMKLEGYFKYNGAYVSLPSATVSNVSQGDRVDWAVNKNGSRIYIYDTSLRYRNDHAFGAEGYLPDYNARRIDGEDGPFEAPAAGANVDISGFVNYVGDDPDGLVPSGNGALSINPFEDGVVWLNESRFVDGQDGFEWPNDLIVNGLPPVISNVVMSDSAVTSTDAVTITADAQGVEGATVTGVNLIYSTPDTADTLAMSGSGTTYSATLPTFDNFTPVSFYIEATDDNGLTGRAPLSGGYNFFVTDEPISAVSFIQETGDGLAGDSPLLGTGELSVDITATVVSSAGANGFITIQDRAAAWSGVYVESENDAENLNVGDQINVTGLIVNETFGVTSIELTEYTVLSATNDQLDTLAVSLITQEVTGSPGAFEKYEGVLLTFNDVKVTTNQADGSNDYGEWEIGSRQGGGAADTLEAGEGLRVDDNVNFGSTTYGSDLNEHVKIGAMIDSFTGVLHYSFGNPKMIMRSLEDVVADDWTLPDTGFGLETPADGAEVTVNGDVSVTWEATTDFDGNEVTYEWVLYSADSSTVLARVPSDDGSSASEVTLAYATVDSLLASAGLEIGESADFVWNVRASDGVDTIAVASDYDAESNTFFPLYYGITLERAMGTSNEVDTGLPQSFDLKQNYPNPFNPTTRIAFDLPQAANVELTVYDMLGRKVATMVNERMNAGRHSMEFDASRLASGMYIYRIKAGSFTSIKKMMLIK